MSPFIDWTRMAGAVERTGAKWSESIRRELELKKAEERGMRMFTFKLGEETKARKDLMKEGNKIALDLERGKAALGSELQTYLGSPQLQAYVTEASKPGQPEFQMQAMGIMDLVGRLQRFERPTPNDTKLLQSLPMGIQAPIATAMGAVGKYYQKQDAETQRFEKWGAHIDAQTEHLGELTRALEAKQTGVQITPEQARKLLDTSTKGLTTLYKDEYFRVLLRKASKQEELKPDELTAWKDYTLRYKVLHGSINAARQVLTGGITPPPMAPPEEAVEPEDEVGQYFKKYTKAFTEGYFPKEGWIDSADRLVQDLIIKGYIGAEEGADKFMAWFKKVIQAVRKGEWEKPVS